MAKKITKVKDRPIDARCPRMTLSCDKYQEGLNKLREKAKKEGKKLLTDNGIEDYTNKE